MLGVSADCNTCFENRKPHRSVWEEDFGAQTLEEEDPAAARESEPATALVAAECVGE